MPFENLLHYLPVGIITYDSERRVTYANEKAASILRQSVDELTRRGYESPEWVVISEEDRLLGIEEFPVHITLSTGEIAKRVVGVVHGSEVIWIRVVSTPYLDGAVVCFWEDTERIEWKREAKRIREQHVIAGAAMSHEARTPLAIVWGNTELLLMGFYGAINDRQREVLEDIMIPKMREQERIIRYCLALWAGEKDHQFSFSQIDPGSVIISAIKDVVDIARSRYDVKLVPSILRGVTILSHPDILNWMISNLVLNAIKFSHSGGIVYVKSEAQDGRYIVEVVDSGIGIPEGELERIFEPFYQVSRGDSRRYGGLGMGLTAVRTFATLHGATISVRSELGKGSTFSVSFPMEGL